MKASPLVRVSAGGLLLAMAAPAGLAAQQSAAPRKPLGPSPVVFDSTSRGPSGVQIPGPKFRVVPVKGLQRPQGMAFLPDGRILVTERAGRLRIVSGDALDPQPVSGLPQVLNRNMRGLNDVALHPKFRENGWVYFTYYKPHPTETDAAAATLARGTFDGSHALTEVTDVFTADTYVTGPSAATILFAPDGRLFMAIGVPIPPRARPGLATPADAQNPASVYGKILRLNDDGSVPPDNPFVGKAGYRGEIYAMGIRNSMGLAIHPVTGELWETENGPQGGDELNVIRPGRNYGWPVISYGRSYSGDAVGETGPVKSPAVAEGMEQPLLFWSPSPALTGIVFYTGDKFPQWKDSAFVGALVGEQIQRVVFNLRGLPTRRDPLIWELGQRIRAVQQGPDGLLYALTEEDDGALLRIEPVETALALAPQAERRAAGAWTVGRTPDGQPDLQGMWSNYDQTPFEQLRPEERTERGPAVSTADWLVQDSPTSPRRPSMVVDPPDGHVPLRPEAIQRRDAAFALDSGALARYGPWERCITRGVPGSMWPGAYNNGHQIIQTPGYVVLHSEMIHEARVVPLDGRPPLGPAARSWDGDSRGRWEGDTLVIETSNFNGKGWIATNAASGRLRGIELSPAARVVERLTRVSESTIQYRATIDDPEVYTRPWTVEFPLNRDDRYRIFEYACHEGNHALEHMLKLGTPP